MASLLKKYKIFIIIGIVIVVAGAIFYARSTFATTSKKTDSKTVHTVTRSDIKETLTLSGEVHAEEKATLRFATSGRLSWIGVKEGDQVKKYQVLASLDQRDLKKTLEKKLNTYMSTRWDFEQTKDDETETADIGITQEIRDAAKRILDKSQFGLNNSVLDVELQSLTLEYANLWTPIAGIVTRIDSPFAGVNITPASAEFEVVNPNSLYLSVLPDQTEVSRLTSSMSAEILFDAYPDVTVPGNITSISFAPKTGESSTVYEIKLSFPPESQMYRIGMTADATFIIKEKNDVLTIPFTFLKTEDGKQYVLRKKGTSQEKAFVTVGFESDESIEITDGITEGDVIYD